MMHIRVRLLLLVALGLVVLAACGVPEEPPPAVRHEVSVALAGDGQGTVTSDPPGIDVAAGTFAASFVHNTVLTLTATPEAGSRFDGFTFDDPDRTCETGSTENTCVITVDDAVDVTATFVDIEDVEEVVLSVVTVGDGTVTSDPPGITGAVDTFTYERGTEVSLTAVPAAGAEFVSWDPEALCDDNGEANVCVLTLTEDTTTITATFTEAVLAEPVDLSVTVVGNGSVVSDPVGIDTADQQTAPFDSDTTVTLTATPATGWTFGGWAPDVCAGGAAANPCVVTLTEDTDLTATFVEVVEGTALLTVNVETGGDAAGRVTSSPEGIDVVDGQDTATFDIGTPITLTAEATAGEFAGWTGDVCPVRNELVCSFTIVEGQPPVTANFNEPTTVMFTTTAGTDTAEEFLADSIRNAVAWPEGYTYTTSDDLELGYDPHHGPQAIGLRFPGVAIPPNANILEATLGFTAWFRGGVSNPGGTGTGNVNLLITGHAVADAPTFVTDPDGEPSRNVTARSRTDASIPWDITATWRNDELYQSSDIASLVTEIVGIENWEQGNAMAFIIVPLDPTSEAFRRAYAGDPVPVLTVQYVPLP